MILSMLAFLCPLWGCASFSASREGEKGDDKALPALHPLQIFKTYISPVDGNRCPMYPSCSSYCRQALAKHGWFMGWIMTCDRLLRCGRDEIHLSPQVFKNVSLYTLDPVESNDFWWSETSHE